MLENNIKDILDIEIDTDVASSETTEASEEALNGISAKKVNDNILENFEDLAAAEVDLSSDKISELNKTLPNWSIVPPKNFVK